MVAPVRTCRGRWRIEKDSIAAGPQEQIAECGAPATCRVVIHRDVFDMCPVCGTAAVAELDAVMISAEVDAESRKMVERAGLLRAWADEAGVLVPEFGDYFRQVAGVVDGFAGEVFARAYQHQQPGS